jgi:hypothetical protein
MPEVIQQRQEEFQTLGLLDEQDQERLDALTADQQVFFLLARETLCRPDITHFSQLSVSENNYRST